MRRLKLALGGVVIFGAGVAVGGQTPQSTPIIDLPRELPRTGGFAFLPAFGGPALAAAILGRRFLTFRKR